MSDFKQGQEVQLKSGGPSMTIQDIAEGSAKCIWFDGTKLKDGDFIVTTLMVAKEEDEELYCPFLKMNLVPTLLDLYKKNGCKTCKEVHDAE